MRQVLRGLAGAGHACLAVGGAGFYWEACTRGFHSMPSSTPETRAEKVRITYGYVRGLPHIED